MKCVVRVSALEDAAGALDHVRVPGKFGKILLATGSPMPSLPGK